MRGSSTGCEIGISTSATGTSTACACDRGFTLRGRALEGVFPCCGLQVFFLAARCFAILLLALSPLLLLAHSAGAAEGDLDPTFGSGGLAYTGLSSDEDSQVAVAIQADGKIVLAGHDEIVYQNFVARFDATGALDSTFGSGGIAYTGLWSSSQSWVAVAIQEDGKIVLAGVDTEVHEHFVARFTTMGVLDSIFGSGGIVHTGFNGSYGARVDVAIQADGKIILASYRPYVDQYYVARFDTTGAFDSSFDGDGIAYTSLEDACGHSGVGVTIQTDGKIVLAGNDRLVWENFLARFDTTGAPDPTFGSGGIARTGVLSMCECGVGVAIQADGKILLVGNDISSAGDYLARFDAAGVLDPSFGNSGIAHTGVYSSDQTRVDVAIQADGRILLAGYEDDPVWEDFVARFDGAGVLDPGFGTGAIAHTGVWSSEISGVGVAIQADRKIVLAGYDGAEDQHFLARFLVRVPRAWYILPDGSGDAPTIQAGIDSAWVGDTVLVACGTYYEYGITVKSGILLTSETGQPDCVTIDAETQGGILTCYDVDSATTLEGLTLTNGYRDGHGGGIVVHYGSPTIRNCIISDCSSTYDAGGMSCLGATPTLIDCVFTGNMSAGRGGGVYCAQSATATLEGCTIANNTALHGGGGLTCVFDASTDLRNCTFYGNSGPDAGGLSVTSNSSVTVENSIVSFSTSGQAVHCDATSSAELTCCDVHGNEGGDWIDCIEDQYGTGGNFAEDPLFCDAGVGDFRLDGDSPCAPANSPVGCELIGACPVGCASEPTPPGSDVYVPLEPFGYLTFESVENAGETGLVVEDAGPDLGEFQAATEPPVFYDITTTAGYSGMIEVCIRYEESDVQGPENELHLLHFEDPDWVDITTLVDTENDIICGETTMLSPFIVAFSTAMAVQVGEEIPGLIRLFPSRPNPFYPATTIRYELSRGERIHLGIYDVAGRLIRTLVDAEQSGGSYAIRWDGRNEDGDAVAGGAYFYRLRVAGEGLTQRAILVR